MRMDGPPCSGIGTLPHSLCQSFRQPQKCCEYRISITPQPYGTELYDLITARDWPENNIQAAATDIRDMLGRATLGDLEGNSGLLRQVPLQQLAKEATGDRRQNTYPYPAHDLAGQSSRLPGRILQLRNELTDAAQNL